MIIKGGYLRVWRRQLIFLSMAGVWAQIGAAFDFFTLRRTGEGILFASVAFCLAAASAVLVARSLPIGAPRPLPPAGRAPVLTGYEIQIIDLPMGDRMVTIGLDRIVSMAALAQAREPHYPPGWPVMGRDGWVMVYRSPNKAAVMVREVRARAGAR